MRMSGMKPPARFGGYCVICGEKAQPGRYPFPLALASRSADHHYDSDAHLAGSRDLGS